MNRLFILILVAGVLSTSVALSQLTSPPSQDSTTQIVLRFMPDQQLALVLSCIQPSHPDRTLEQITYNQFLFSYLFTPTGYVTVMTRQQTEVRLPAASMLRRCRQLPDRSYTFQQGSWSHFKAAERVNGRPTVQITTYPAVETFIDHKPQTTQRISQVLVPIDVELPAPDYWQLVELVLREDDAPISGNRKVSVQRHP